MNSFDKHTLIKGNHESSLCYECVRIALLEKVAIEAAGAIDGWVRPSIDGTHLRIPIFVVPLKDAVLALQTVDIQLDTVQ